MEIQGTQKNLNNLEKIEQNGRTQNSLLQNYYKATVLKTLIERIIDGMQLRDQKQAFMVNLQAIRFQQGCQDNQCGK